MSSSYESAGSAKLAAAKRRIIPFLILSCGLVLTANAQLRRQPPGRGSLSPNSRGRLIEINKRRALIPDAQVFDHRGRRVRLYSDLVKGKVVLLSFFFTECSYVCHLQGTDLSKIQAGLGPRLGKDVSLISISMNPADDTPAKLKGWARAYGVKPGWTLVSGGGPEMAKMIRDFTGNDPGAREVHLPIVILGNDRTGTWLAADGLEGPGHLVKLIEHVIGGGAPGRSE